MNIYRHGDVDIIPTDKKVSGNKSKSVILAYGEVTGHKHVLSALDKKTFIQQVLGEAEHLIKISNGRAQLTHQEHSPLILSPGTYEVKIEREYDPFLKKINEVKD